MSNLLPFIVTGIVTGIIYGLAGSGLVLTFKTSGIFNFGHGAVLTGAVLVFYWLRVTLQLDWKIAFFASVAALVLAGVLGVWALLVFAALPRLRETLATFRAPKPAAPPPRYPIWPLWYVAWAFRLTRRAGTLLVLGLLIDAWIPLHVGR